MTAPRGIVDIVDPLKFKRWYRSRIQWSMLLSLVLEILEPRMRPDRSNNLGWLSTAHIGKLIISCQ